MSIVGCSAECAPDKSYQTKTGARVGAGELELFNVATKTAQVVAPFLIANAIAARPPLPAKFHNYPAMDLHEKGLAEGDVYVSDESLELLVSDEKIRQACFNIGEELKRHLKRSGGKKTQPTKIDMEWDEVVETCAIELRKAGAQNAAFFLRALKEKDAFRSFWLTIADKSKLEHTVKEMRSVFKGIVTETSNSAREGRFYVSLSVMAGLIVSCVMSRMQPTTQYSAITGRSAHSKADTPLSIVLSLVVVATVSLRSGEAFVCIFSGGTIGFLPEIADYLIGRQRVNSLFRVSPSVQRQAMHAIEDIRRERDARD